jgi:hypothetical protein
MNLAPLATFAGNIIGFINAVLVPLVLAIAFIAFLYGVFQYFIAGGANEEKRKQGRDFVMWSIIGFVVMFSLWGVVNLLMSSLGLNNNARPALPTFGGPSSSVNSSNPFGNTTGALPNGAACPSKDDNLCQSGECDMNASGSWVCVTPTDTSSTNTEATGEEGQACNPDFTCNNPSLNCNVSEGVCESGMNP